MGGLSNLKLRLGYQGPTVEDRLRKDKLRTLKRALFNSYQAETAVLSDEREFKCLINRDKITDDYDDKIISIPFKDICLNKPRVGKTTEGEEEIGMKSGDVFKWKENGSYWIVYLQKIEEEAYFRAKIRKCRYELKINDTVYKIYFKGPTATDIDWNSKGNLYWNSLNYDAMITITLNEETMSFFDRFVKVKIAGRNWEVQATDKLSTEGVINVYLKEDYSNTVADEEAEREIEVAPILPEPGSPQILGDAVVYPYDIKVYTVENIENGNWIINSNKVKILNQNNADIKIEIVSGRSGKFDIIYQNEETSITLPVEIESL